MNGLKPAVYRRLCEDAKLLVEYRHEELEATGELEELASDIAEFLIDYHGYTDPNYECDPGKVSDAIYDYIVNNWS